MTLTWMHIALLLFLPTGVLFGGAPQLALRLLATRLSNKRLLEPYGCGIPLRPRPPGGPAGGPVRPAGKDHRSVNRTQADA